MGDEEKARKNKNKGWGEGQERCLNTALFRLTCLRILGNEQREQKGYFPRNNSPGSEGLTTLLGGRNNSFHLQNF